MATLAQNIQRAIDDFNSIENAIVQKGVPVPDGTPTSQYGEKILSIETGVDTSGDTVVPSALREGYTAHDAAGQEITGTIPNYDGGDTVELTSPEGATLNTAGTYCEGNIEVVPKLQSKTATTGEIVTADDGYVGLSSVDVTPVYEAGEKSAYDAFWDIYQENGKRIGYQHAFSGAGWTNETCKPKYDIIPVDVYMMISFSRITDLDALCDRCGVKFDLSQCYNLHYLVFSQHKIERLRVIDTRAATHLHCVINNAQGLHTIEKFIYKEDGSQTSDGEFYYLPALVNITVEGTIGHGKFNLWNSHGLSKASIVSIINALSATTSGLTVTLSKNAINKAFETSDGANNGTSSEEWLQLISTKPNWTINLING